jgi:hypothetical protein
MANSVPVQGVCMASQVQVLSLITGRGPILWKVCKVMGSEECDIDAGYLIIINQKRQL